MHGVMGGERPGPDVGARRKRTHHSPAAPHDVPPLLEHVPLDLEPPVTAERELECSVRLAGGVDGHHGAVNDEQPLPPSQHGVAWEGPRLVLIR